MIKWKRFSKCSLSLFAGVAAVLMLAVQPSFCAYLAEPDAYWQLEDTGNIADDVGTANGTCTNCPTAASGQIANGFIFDGSNDSVVFADNAAFDFAAGGSFSIELWMKRNGLPANFEAFIGRHGGANAVAWWVGIGKNGAVTSHFWDADGPFVPMPTSGGSNISDNQWHHVVAVRDGVADQIRIYVDGELDGIQDQSGDTTSDGSFASTANVTLGNQNNAIFFEGSLDNVAIYSQEALSADIIRHNYLNGVTKHSLAEEFEPTFVSDSVSDAVVVGLNATLHAQAAGNPIPTYASDDLPAGATIDSATGEIVWLASSGQIGDNLFSVEASNSQGTATQNWTVTVEDLCASAQQTYWQLEESDPATEGAVDETGTVDGTCTNCPTSDAGKIDNGFVFDGTGNEVVFPANAVFDFTAGSSFSIELWMKHDAAPASNQVMIGRSSGAGAYWWVGIGTAGTVSCDFRDEDGPASTQLNGATLVVDNEWHHVVVVRDGAGDNLLIYVDGRQDAIVDQSADDITDGSFASAANVTLGALNSNFFFAGTLDEVAIYDVALSSTIIAQHSTAKVGYCSVDSPGDNNPPEITSRAKTTVSAGTEYKYQAVATDADGDALTWSLTNAPKGMKVDATTGLVTWTPASGTTTSGKVTLKVIDGNGGEDSEVFTISVSGNGGGGGGGDDDGGGGGGGGCFIQSSGSAAAHNMLKWFVILGSLAGLALGVAATNGKK